MDDDDDEIAVKNWAEVSRVLTNMQRRLRDAEAVTTPVRKIWASMKWGGFVALLGIILGASPQSPLGQFFVWITTDVPQ